ncbi:uncharacterized protein LOC110914238 [Helianthus annuus]|uniref:uncharacterized protein LOC110914238 n=1 Tax=Helianthus annuus TaxID=4232 RepID=UPI000B8FC2DF|nr:uncharacterized protein LOC110914238 [Helianthus annuus]
MFPDLFRLEMDKRCKVSDRIVEDDSGRTFRWRWKRVPDAVSEITEFQDLFELSQGAVFSGGRDRWRWIADSKGNFSVASVRKLLIFGLDVSSRFVFQWCNLVPLKCNILAWRAEMGKLPSCLALRYRNVSVGSVACSLYDGCDESVDHIFTSCPVAERVWSWITAWCKVPVFLIFLVKDLLEWHLFSGLSEGAKVAFQGIIIVACWCLWLARNDARFNGISVKVDNICSQIKALVYLWFHNRSKFKGVSWVEWCRFVIM